MNSIIKKFFIIIFCFSFLNSMEKQIIQICHKEKKQDHMVNKPNLILDIDDFLLHIPPEVIHHP